MGHAKCSLTMQIINALSYTKHNCNKHKQAIVKGVLIQVITQGSYACSYSSVILASILFKSTCHQFWSLLFRGSLFGWIVMQHLRVLRWASQQCLQWRLSWRRQMYVHKLYAALDKMLSYAQSFVGVTVFVYSSGRYRVWMQKHISCKPR